MLEILPRGQNLKSVFHSKISVSRHELGVKTLQPLPRPGNSNSVSGRGNDFLPFFGMVKQVETPDNQRPTIVCDIREPFRRTI